MPGWAVRNTVKAFLCGSGVHKFSKFAVASCVQPSNVIFSLKENTKVLRLAKSASPVVSDSRINGAILVRNLAVRSHSVYAATRPIILERSLSTAAPKDSLAVDIASQTVGSSEVDSNAVAEVVTALDPIPSGWYPWDLAECGIVAIHDAFGLPWYLSIAGITITLRVLLFPLMVYQMRNMGRLMYIKDDLESITKQWKAAGGASAPPQMTDYFQGKMKQLFEKHHCHPMRSMLSMFVQAPLFISFFFALRHMSDTYPSFRTGGALWFTDLSATDPTYMLPVISGVSMLIALELGADTGKAMSQQEGTTRIFFRCFALVMVPSLIFAGIPNGVFMYWMSANAFSLTQLLIFKIPFVKPMLGIPAPPPRAVTPAAIAAAAAAAGPVIPAAVYSSRQAAADAAGKAAAAGAGAARAGRAG